MLVRIDNGIEAKSEMAQSIFIGLLIINVMSMVAKCAAKRWNSATAVVSTLEWRVRPHARLGLGALDRSTETERIPGTRGKGRRTSISSSGYELCFGWG